MQGSLWCRQNYVKLGTLNLASDVDSLVSLNFWMFYDSTSVKKIPADDLGI